MASENYFDEDGKEVWERNRMNLEVQTTLLDTYPPKLITTILKALREQLKEHDQLSTVEDIAGPAPDSGTTVMEDICQKDFVLAARRE